MSLTKRGKYYSYEFQFKGQEYRGPTHQTDKNKAKLFEAKVRSDVAMAERGLAPKEEKEVLLFSTFIRERFIPHVEREHATKPGTMNFYLYTATRLLDFPGFNAKRLDEINGNVIEKYKEWRTIQKKRRGKKGRTQVSTINSELRVLRKALLWAYDLD